jgi:hypothetical protein
MKATPVSWKRPASKYIQENVAYLYIKNKDQNYALIILLYKKKLKLRWVC